MKTKGFVFTTEAVFGIAFLLVLAAGMALLVENSQTKPDSKEWFQTKAILDTQTNLLTNSNQGHYKEPNDYYCYRLYRLDIGIGSKIQDSNNCEEIP